MPTATAPPLRILLVEDDLDQAHLIKFLLESGGKYAVTLAQDGLRGTLLVRDHDWDLIITDLNLPGADGMEVVDTAKTHRPETPVLATTGYSGPQYADEALRKGATDVLIKPLEKDELLSKVAALIAMSAPTEAEFDAEEPPAPAKASSGDGAGATVRGGGSAPPKTPGKRGAPSAPAGKGRTGEASKIEALAPDSGAEMAAPADRPLRVLAVSVRPGDAEAGCGGTLLLHRDRGDRVILLTLTQGGGGEEGASRRDQAKEAGRKMGVRYFVGNAGSGGDAVDDDIRRLVRGSLAEIRPDVVYLPTLHHPDATLEVAHEAVVNEGAGMYSIYAYDPGDAGPEFRPDSFVTIKGRLEEKLGVVKAFDAELGAHLSPERAEVAASFWGRFGGGKPTEAFEAIRGDPPPWREETSLLPSDD